MSRTGRLVPVAAALLVGLAAVPAAGVAADATWHVVRFDHRITQGDREALEAAGAAALQYLPSDAYMAWMGPDAPARAEAIDGVTSVLPLSPAAKVDRALDLTAPARPLTVTAHASAAGAVRASVGAIPGLRLAADHPVPATDLRDLIVVGSPSLAPRLASLPAVAYVGPGPSGPAPLDEVSDQILAGAAPLAPGYEQFLEGADLSGEGVRVSVVDSGVDEHPDMAGRIVAHVKYEAYPGGEPVDTFGHGTHVAGIVGANAAGLPPAAGRLEDPNGFLYGLGVAPQVEMVDQAALSTTASLALCNVAWPPSYPWSRLTKDALAAGASIWNASWWSCENSRGDYIATARTFDILARNADPDTDAAEPFTFVHAAGNFGPSSPSIGSPGGAKNLITVGASNNARGGNPNAMANFSSRGPLGDGRVGPTVSAPGVSIVSTKSFGAGGACFEPPGTHADGLVAASLYSSCSGTSMAAPHVTGAVALITEWWRKAGDDDPSPAMTKALLVNTARDMGTPDIPNANEGWGRVDLGELFDPEAERVYEDQSVVLTEPDDAVGYRIRPADPSKPLKVTLAWSDAPGAAGADPALVNDLDLTVEASDGTTYLGNVFDRGTSIPGGSPDRLNNVENVFLETPSGEYEVTVRAFNLPGDGVPFSGDETDQDFALVISNAVVVEVE